MKLLVHLILILISRMVRSSEQALAVGGKQVARVCHTKKYYKQRMGANCDGCNFQTSILQPLAGHTRDSISIQQRFLELSGQ